MENLCFKIRANIEFMVKLGWSSGEIIDALKKVYGDQSPSRGQVFEWIKRFKKGREELKDDQRSGRLSTSTNEDMSAKVQEMLDKDERISITEIARNLNISYGSVYIILTDRLRLSKLSARWVPKALRSEHMIQRAEASVLFLNMLQADPENFVFSHCNWGWDMDLPV
ncbi:Protein GVQW3 [Anthophora plagiata]